MTSPAPIESFLAKLRASFADNSFVRLTLSKPVTANSKEKVTARLIELRGAPCLSITRQHGKQTFTHNLSLREADEWIRGWLNDEFYNALLNTSRRDWQLHLPAQGRIRLVSHKPAFSTIPARTHDEPGRGILDESAHDWLHGLGITDAKGRVRVTMSDKYRQINHYLEILSHLAIDCGWLQRLQVGSPAKLTRLQPTEERTETRLTLADMGCGKGYLTFGAWHLFHRAHRLNAHVIGLETRQELVRLTSALARRIGADGLDFFAGSIESAQLPQLDALIALHACNTATDDAIRRGIELGAKLIVVAPCCHQELRPQLGRPEPLAAVLQHGIMAERLAEWLTDGLRALHLEWAGYRTKVFEFVSSEHTPKNLMIAAIRERKPFADEAVRQQILALKRNFGIRQYALDKLMERR